MRRQKTHSLLCDHKMRPGGPIIVYYAVLTRASRRKDASERHGRALSDSIFARTGSFDLSAQVLTIECPLNTLAAPLARKSRVTGGRDTREQRKDASERHGRALSDSIFARTHHASIIDPGGSWAISIKEKPGRRHHFTCLEVDQLLERPTSNSQTI